MRIRKLRGLDEFEMKKILERQLGFEEVVEKVKRVVEDVRKHGDKALVKYTRKFDGVRVSRPKIKVSEEELEEAYGKVSEKLVDAIRFAIENIEEFHRKQLSQFTFERIRGVRIKQIIRPVELAGIYVPGGRAAYPSTVLMATIPAKVAGVERVIVCTPPNQNGDVRPETLVACNEVGVRDIFRVGGAQAIAAMAYGTETVPKTNVVVGPGNIYVAAAKIAVSKDVRVDLPAGPSEILILADESCDPLFVAADLVSQAEHDPLASVVLVTTSEKVAKEVKRLSYELALKVATRDVAVKVLGRGWCILVDGVDEAVEFINKYAPEHLEIHVENPHYVLERVMNAGAIFIGQYTPVALGDYAAGSNHILPTGGYAKSFSGLTVESFVKRISVVECSFDGFKALSESVVTLAEAEGLPAHAQAVRLRLEKHES